jgi:hypothetical protein
MHPLPCFINYQLVIHLVSSLLTSYLFLSQDDFGANLRHRIILFVNMSVFIYER